MEALEEYEKGLAFYEEDNGEKAIECFERVVELSPDEELKLKLAGILTDMVIDFEERREYAKIRKCCEALIKLNPCDANAYFLMGDAYYRPEGYYDEAFEYYDKAIGLDSSLVYEYCKELYFCYTEKILSYDIVVKHYEKALRINPAAEKLKYELADVYLDMAAECLEKGVYDKALECFKKVIELNPEYGDHNAAEDWWLKGNAHTWDSNDEAIECYKKAVKLNPKCWKKAYIGIIDACNNKKDYDRAEKITIIISGK